MSFEVSYESFILLSCYSTLCDRFATTHTFVYRIVNWPWNRDNILTVLFWLHIIETYLFLLPWYFASSLTQSSWLFYHAILLIFSVDPAFVVIIVHIILIGCIFVKAISFAFKSWSLLLLGRFLFKILYDTLHIYKALAEIIGDFS